jgi:hypothetical protein
MESAARPGARDDPAALGLDRRIVAAVECSQVVYTPRLGYKPRSLIFGRASER